MAKKTEDTGSYLLAYTIRTISEDKLGRRKQLDTDHFEIFTEEDKDGRSPRAQATRRRKQLEGFYEDSEEGEVYTWNVAKIVDTSEHYDL